MSNHPGIRRMGNADGLVVSGDPARNAEGAAARVRLLDTGIAELTVLQGRGTFPSTIVIDRYAAGALVVELLRLWCYLDVDVAALERRAEAVEEARNSGDGTVPLRLIDDLTEAVRQVVPAADMAGGTGARRD